MVEELRELGQYRELLLILVRRDLKVRYKNSVLGFGWSLINPLVQVLMITLVLQFMQGKHAQNYHAYVFCATLPWLFFNTAVMDSSGSLVSFHNLLKRTYFPREIIPLSTICANLIHFALATGVFLAYMALNALFWGIRNHKLDWPIQPTVFFLPIPMFGIALLVTGLALFLSVWTLYFEDVRFLAESALRIVYWTTPVICFYLQDLILERKGWVWYTLYMLDPLNTFIAVFRKMTLADAKILHPLGGSGGPPIAPAMTPIDWMFLGISLLLSAAFFLAGHRYFSRRKWKLAERG